MRRFASFVVVATLAATGCKGGPVRGAGGFLNIFYPDLDAGSLVTNTSIKFGDACPGFPLSRELFIRDDDSPSVQITSVSLSNTTAFSLVPPVIAANTQVQGGMVVTQTVSFNPTGQGPQPSSTFTIATADGTPLTASGNGATYTVTLSGNGISAPTAPTVAYNCPESAAGSATTCNSLLFPTTYVGLTSNLKLNIEDQGCTPLTLTAAIVCGDAGAMPFSILGSVPSTVGYGNPVTLSVQYAPIMLTSADLGCSLVLGTNDTANATITIPLVGTNSEATVTITSPFPCPPPGTGGYLIDAGGKPGAVDVGASVIFPITIADQGALPIQVGMPYFADGGAGYIVLDGGWSGTLYPLGSDAGPSSATFYVEFTSPAAGNFINTLVIPVTNGTAQECLMEANSGGVLCTVPMGVSQITLPDTMTLCGHTSACLTLQNCGTAPVHVFAATVNGGAMSFDTVVDAGSIPATIQPNQDFPVCVSFTDPGSLGIADGGQPYIQNVNLSTDAPGYDAGYVFTASATTYYVPQPANVPPTPISGWNDAGYFYGLDDGGNATQGQQMVFLADIDAGMGMYYDFTWATPAIVGSNGFVNVCADGGVLPDGGILPGISLSYVDGGEFYVTPIQKWNFGSGVLPVCKVCVFLKEKEILSPPPTGNCNFNGGTVPNAFHCWGCSDSSHCNPVTGEP
jgi:hypothetical protein